MRRALANTGTAFRVFVLTIIASTNETPAESVPSVEMDAIIVEAARVRAWAPTTSGAIRTEAPLIEIPQSIQVLPRQLIEEQEARTMADALVNVSGIVPVRTHETLILSPLVRGFAAETYVDGLPTYSFSSAPDPATLINVESIEVIKGPTAALFGGGVGSPLGGIINVVTPRPMPGQRMNAGLRAGSDSLFNPFADINTPINGDGSLAFRLTGDVERSNSHIAEARHERWSLNPTFRWEAGPDTTVTFQGQFSTLRQLEYTGLPAALVIPPATHNVEAYSGPRVDPHRFAGALDGPLSEIVNSRLVASLEHTFSDHLKLNLAAQYYGNSFEEYAIYTFASAQSPLNQMPNIYPVLSGYLPSDVDQFTLNGWLTGKFEAGPTRHELIFGANLDFTRNTAQLGFSHLRIPLPEPYPDTILPIRVGFVDFADSASFVPYSRPGIVDQTENDFQTWGVYLQDRITAFERLNLLAGARLIGLNVDHRFDTENTVGISTRYEQEYLELAPRLGAILDLGAGVSSFAAWSQGLRGVLNYSGRQAPEPERSQMIEGGFKFLNDALHLSGSLAIYQLIRENVPTANPFIPGSTVQIGEQQSRGIELDLAWEPVPEFSLLLAYAYTDAEVTADVINEVPTDGQDIDRVGKRLPRIPEHGARLAARYRVLDGELKGLGFGIGISAASMRPVSFTNNYFTDPYHVIDAQISYDFEPYSAAISIANVTDRFFYEPYPYLGEDVVAPARPLSVFLTLTRTF